uniref:uncharacterized protein LOC120334603 n=1 Tax=Styela clava TaxID=7725 RepID=UPI001939552C|nr:uncharacterized protein LOC120334603 [Styela clava]
METHANIAVMSEEARNRVFHYRYKSLIKSQAVLCRVLSQNNKIEIFSYKTAFLIARHKRPFTESETIIKPALNIFCEIFEGELFARKVQEAVNKSALCNNTITRLIQTIAADLKEQLLEDFRISPWTALAVNESTDTTAQAQLLIFGRFLKESSVTGNCLLAFHLKPQEAKIFLVEFNAMIDVDFHGELDFGEAKKDLLDYLRNLTENMNLRFKDLIAESFDFVQFPFKTDIFITNCGAIALEMAELQADVEERINFDVFQGSVLDTVTKQVFSS